MSISTATSKHPESRPAQIIINRKLFTIGISVLVLFSALLLATCVFAWKIKEEVKAYSTKAQEFEKKVDELIIKKETVHRRRNSYVTIQGSISPDLLILNPYFVNIENFGAFLFYCRTVNIGLQQLGSKDTLMFKVSEQGNFTLRIPNNKEFVSRSNEGISISKRTDVSNFLKNALFVKFAIGRPPQNILDVVGTSQASQRDSLSVPTSGPIFSLSIDSAHYDIMTKRYKVAVNEKKAASLVLNPGLGIKVPFKNNPALNN